RGGGRCRGGLPARGAPAGRRRGQHVGGGGGRARGGLRLQLEGRLGLGLLRRLLEGVALVRLLRGQRGGGTGGGDRPCRQRPGDDGHDADRAIAVPSGGRMPHDRKPSRDRCEGAVSHWSRTRQEIRAVPSPLVRQEKGQGRVKNPPGFLCAELRSARCRLEGPGPSVPGSGAPRRPANRTSTSAPKARAPDLPAPEASEGSPPVAFRPNPAIVAGAVMGTLLAAAAYIALSGAAPVGAHITEVKPI